jgi:Uma2 family endonuclease
LRRSADAYYVPDIAIIPAAAVQALLDDPRSLDAYPVALPLVIEVWSPSTGRYDIRKKLPDYQARGDREIWYIHPSNRTLTAWRRQPDGTYLETIYRSGIIQSD